LSEQQMHGVWFSTAGFKSGVQPNMAGRSSWNEVIQSIKDTHPDVHKNNHFVAFHNGERWVPLAFVNPRTGKSNPISDNQVPKYQRSRANSDGDESIPGVVPQQQEAQPAEEAGLVLRLNPQLAETLRDAFTLVAQGRPVTIMTVESPQQ
jgi:hypothetical protein